jgi:UDP-N-acetyl-D-mannosaminuronic acid dehydrogenase
MVPRKRVGCLYKGGFRVTTIEAGVGIPTRLPLSVPPSGVDTNATSDPTSRSDRFTTDVVIIGGCGHVGLPLGIAFSERGLKTRLFDVNSDAVTLVNRATMPFSEQGAADVLRRVVDDGSLQASTDPRVVQDAEHVVVVIGTPVDEHLNPDPHAIPRALSECADHLRDGQLLILRSTVYPGVTALVERTLAQRGLSLDVAFCPERIAEGKAMTELYSLPQIVAGRTEAVRDRAARLFSRLTDTVVQLEPEEAELAKLFTNTWRYVKFATANQFFMIANDFGLDFERIRHALTYEYPRAADMPGPGFAAGPCLFKDTMQLAAFNKNNFVLGHSAMLINEGLPLYIVDKLEARYPDLPEKTVAILGMAFKGESDDTRASLSYKLRRILHFKCGRVLCTDPYVTTDPTLVSFEEAVEQADVLIIAAPHVRYRELQTDKPVVDIWNLRGHGSRV